MIDYSFTAAFDQVKSTIGGVTQTVQDGLRGFGQAISSLWENLKAAVVNAWDAMLTALKDLWDTKPWIVIIAAAAAVLTVPVWGPVVLRMLLNVPRVVIHVLKLPFVALGLIR